MKKSAIVLLVTTVLLLPVGLKACDDCDCGCPGPAPVHFKDGLTPNGPVTGDAVYGDPSYYSSTYGFRDYASTKTVVVPPPPVDTKEMKHPSS